MGISFCGSKLKKNRSKNLPALLSRDLPIDTLLPYSDSRYFKKNQILHYNRLLLIESIQEPMTPPINWEAFQVIGSGSFGRVLYCKDAETQKSLAVKEIPLIGLNNVKSVCEEFNILSQLHHANIVQYLGYKIQTEVLLIFMEFVPNGTIQGWLDKNGSFGEELIRKYVRQIVLGLEYLHYHNIVHRDLKGTNILIGEEDECKLADFGSAKNILGIEATASVTGTFNWMAPEIIKETGHGRFADIWSLGCLVVEMSTGKPPWAGYTRIQIINTVIGTEDVPDIPSHYSQSLKSFASQCFARDPYKRPNVTELLLHPFLN